MKSIQTPVFVRHQLLSGGTLEYAQGPMAAFVTRVARLARSPKVPYGYVSFLIFSGANSLMRPDAQIGKSKIGQLAAAHPAWAHLQDLLERKRLGEIEPLPETDQVCPGFRSRLVARWGTMGSAHMKFKIPLPIGHLLGTTTPPGVNIGLRQTEPGVFEGQAPEGWKTASILTVGKKDESSRFFLLSHPMDGNWLEPLEFKFGGLYVGGLFDITWHTNNAEAAQAAYRRYAAEWYPQG